MPVRADYRVSSELKFTRYARDSVPACSIRYEHPWGNVVKVTTDWLPPPDAIVGLDHLGTQAPCQLIYSQLLPGITNVTDRARYYSLYPWLIRAFDTEFPDADASEFVKLFRHGDFLLTLIAERHARVHSEPDWKHGAAMAGRDQMAQAMSELDEVGAITFERFTTMEPVDTRYFKSRLGGLSQYYVGTLAELGLLDTTTTQWVKYTHEFGAPLAAAVEQAVPAKRFWSVVAAGVATAKDLDALHSFCPCGLAEGSEEHSALMNIFFAESDPYAKPGKQRRASLGMWLHLAHALSEDEQNLFNMRSFRGAIYAGTLPANVPWDLPGDLAATRALWRTYEANDLLSVAFQGVFASALEQLSVRQSAGLAPFPTVEALADDFSQGPITTALIEAFGPEGFGATIESLKQSAPQVGDWRNPLHEHELCIRLLSLWRTHVSEAERFRIAFHTIALLIARDDHNRSAYAGLAVSTEDLRNYPINLNTLRERATQWSTMSLRAVIRDVVLWCLTTHLSVAIRKLRQTGRSTFRFRPGELGLEITDKTPIPTRTIPRFNQATQILVDLRTLQHRSADNADALQVTPLGLRMMLNHGQ
jgi:hypothetical protein